MLGAMLGGHPNVVTVPESQWLIHAVNMAMASEGPCDAAKVIRKITKNWRFRWWDLQIDEQALLHDLPVEAGVPCVAEITRRIVRQYAQKQGKPDATIWVDHTPEHLRYLMRLFETFPRGQAIHLVRDGRAVAASVMPLDWGPNTIIRAAQWWAARVGAGVAAEWHFAEGKVVRVRYERLVQTPESSLQWLCEQMEWEYDEKMAAGAGFAVPRFTAEQHALVGSAPDASRAFKWKEKLTPRQIELFEITTGDLLRYFGYELMGRFDAPLPSHRERLGSDLKHVLRSQLIDHFKIKARKKK